MNNSALQQAIAADIETLKQMDNYPMDLGRYHSARRRWVFRLFCLMWLTFFGISCFQTYILRGDTPFVTINDWILCGVFDAIMACLLTVMSFPFIHDSLFFNAYLKNKLRMGALVWKKIVAFGWMTYGGFTGSCLIHAHHHGDFVWMTVTIDVVKLGVLVLILAVAFKYTLGLFAREGLMKALVNCCSKNKPLSRKKRSVLT